MTSPLQQYTMLAILLVCSISFPAPSSGLVCNQCGPSQCYVNSTTCEVPLGGRCFTCVYKDISGHNWNMMQGCVDYRSEYYCRVNETDGHVSECCDDGNKCNEDLLEIPSIKCNCVGDKCDHSDPEHCTLKSHKYSCYTTLNRAGGHITHKKGCVKHCKDRRISDEITICCRDNKCNNHSTKVWPPPPKPTTYTTTKQPVASTTTSNPGDNPTTGGFLTTATTVQPTTELRHPWNIKCHCTKCDTPITTCEATIGCLLVTIAGSQYITSCVNDDSSCSNDSSVFNVSSVDMKVMCCKHDNCNTPPKYIPTDPCMPSDDEDAEQSGCDMSPVTSLTVSSSTTTASTATTSTTSSSSTTNAVNTGSTKATPTSSSKATPTKGITAEESEDEDDDSQITIIFYFFTVLLTICIIIMIVVIVVCVGLVYHYKGMAYNKTVLSSSTILESALKEKGFRININSSPI